MVAPGREVVAGRVAVVTAGLIGGGAIAGGMAGSIGAALAVGIHDGLRAALDPMVWLFAGLIGAPLGAILLPIAGFTVLRYVRLGRVLVVTILGTALGGAAGVQVTAGGWLTGALLGFALASISLWREAWQAGRNQRMGLPGTR